LKKQELSSFTVSDLPREQRPRERLEEQGAAALTDPELLAVILGRGTRNRPVLQLAQDLIAEFGGIPGIAQASLDDLQTKKGIGLAKATQLKAAAEFGKRLEKAPRKTVIDSPEKAARAAGPELQGVKTERLVVLCLDARNHLLKVKEVSRGGLDRAIADPRIILKTALMYDACSMILVHNHPSGDPEPSAEDISLTRRLGELSRTVGVELLDHIVYCDRDNVSLKNRKLM
jgi:DNA repair protein RadC